MSETPAMKIDPVRANALVSKLQDVQQRVTAIAKGRSVRLVAVSKLHPANDILALHRPPACHAHFGENYAQELAAKAALLPRSIHWHFIGALQSSHCKALARIPNLFAVSSVDSQKKAALLDKARGAFLADEEARAKQQQQDGGGDDDDDDDDEGGAAGRAEEEEGEEEEGPRRDGHRRRHRRRRCRRLGVHVQVNTSGEPAKAGAAPGADVVALARFVVTACPHLRLRGLMTIGAVARSAATTAETENEDFRVLCEQRDLLAAELGELWTAEGKEGAGELELSMGMSEDFEGAVAMGSGEVRVGSTIFGSRPAKADAKVVV